MKVIRVLVYEMPEKDMMKQLSGSLPEGIRQIDQCRKITVRTITDIGEALDKTLMDAVREEEAK